MRGILNVFLLVLMLLLATPVLAEENKITETEVNTFGTVIEDGVRVRKSHDTSSEIITKLQSGEEVMILSKIDTSQDENPSWYLIAIEGGYGYVFTELIALDEPETETPSSIEVTPKKLPTFVIGILAVVNFGGMFWTYLYFSKKMEEKDEAEAKAAAEAAAAEAKAKAAEEAAAAEAEAKAAEAEAKAAAEEEAAAKPKLTKEEVKRLRKGLKKLENQL